MMGEELEEIRRLTREANQLAAELRSVSARLMSISTYRMLRFWSLMLAAMAGCVGFIFFIGGQERLRASAYSVIAAIGHTTWGVAFLASSFFVALCVLTRSRLLRWALLIEGIPYAGLAVSFTIAAWKFPEANLTAAPVYTWIMIAHVAIADFVSKEQ